MAKKNGGLREITKAQAGKRAQIEKLIDSERKKAHFDPATPRPYACFAVRPIVRLPGQSLTSVSGNQAGRRPYQKSGRPPLQVIPRPIPAPQVPIPKSTGCPLRISVNLPLPKPAPEPIACKQFNFLLLPGELRNKIYNYAFPEEFFQLQWIEKTDSYLTYSLPKRGKIGPCLGPSAGRRRRLFDYPRRVRSKEVIPPYRLSPGPAALLLTCKKVNEEATAIFYASSTFSFKAPNILRAFLKPLSPTAKDAICSIAIKHYTAGNPRYTDFQQWKRTSDRNWDDLLWDAADDLVSLDHLSIDLTINDVPVFFGPNVSWKVPFLAFQEMGIKKCEVTLRNFTTPPAVLEVEQYVLRKEILGKEFREEDEVEADRKKALAALAGKRRRVRVMNLVNG